MAPNCRPVDSRRPHALRTWRVWRSLFPSRREHQALKALPAASAQAPNVLLHCPRPVRGDALSSAEKIVLIAKVLRLALIKGRFQFSQCAVWLHLCCGSWIVFVWML